MLTDLNSNIVFVLYDVKNLPVRIYFTDNTIADYVYDTEGQRIKTANSSTSVTWNYIHDVNGQTIMRIKNEGSTVAKVIHNLFGNDIIGTNSVTSTSEERNYFLKDHLGSVKVIVSESGNVKSYTDYDPFGLQLENRYATDNTERYKFTSKERDAETGYDWFNPGRYYDSKIGRWLQVDPLSEKYPEWSAYNYTMNNPVKLIDTDGKDVAYHSSAMKNSKFNEAIKLASETKEGKRQMERFKNDHNILVIYAVGNLEKTSGGTVGGYTDWKYGSQQAQLVGIENEQAEIKYETFSNEGKQVIVITMDANALENSKVETSSERIYHEGKAHVEFARDKNDLTGVLFSAEEEHKMYGTNGVSPVRKGSPAEKIIKELKEVKQKENKE